MTGRGAMRSDYMHWAKTQQPVRYRLSASEVPHFRLDSLGIDIADLETDGASHPRYAPLLEAIAAHHGVTADGVVSAEGTSGANFLAMAALIEPGDEVLIERPAYEPILATARLLGAEVRRFDRPAEEGFALDPDRVAAAMTDRTALIVVTNLHNPSGAAASDDALARVGALAERHGARVLVDEVYREAAVPVPATAALLGPSFVATSSLTKCFGLSGLRCGWIVAEPELAARMVRLNDLFGVNRPHQAERLACIAFANLDRVLAGTGELLARNRAAFDAFVVGRDDLECPPSRQGITAFPRWLGGDTEPLDAVLRARFDTGVVPGRWFEMPDRFRVGFGMAGEDFEEALARLGSGLDAMRARARASC